MSDTKMILIAVIAMFVFFISCIAAVAVGEYYGEQERTEQMQACVAAGKTWVRNGHTDYYDCM